MKQTEKKLLKLTIELKERIEEAASKEGISSNDFIRLAIEDRLKASGSVDKVYTQTRADIQKPEKVYTQKPTESKKVYTQPQNPESDFLKFKRFRKTPYTQY